MREATYRKALQKAIRAAFGAIAAGERMEHPNSAVLGWLMAEADLSKDEYDHLNESVRRAPRAKRRAQRMPEFWSDPQGIANKIKAMPDPPEGGDAFGFLGGICLGVVDTMVAEGVLKKSQKKLFLLATYDLIVMGYKLGKLESSSQNTEAGRADGS